mgnify:CR=1 FL=1
MYTPDIRNVGRVRTNPLPIRPATRTHLTMDGVFKGGGSLGAAYPGALRAMETRGIWFDRVAGTSAGSILASLIAAGFRADEIEFLSAPAEMNKVTLKNGDTWWTFGLESFGSLVTVEDDLVAVASTLLERGLPLFDGICASYPAWLDGHVKNSTER